MARKPRGRPRRYAAYERELLGQAKGASKRPKYVDGIGVFRGAKSDTAWIKVRLPHGGIIKGKVYPRGAAAEIKVGNLASWSWEDLESKRGELQKKADRGEALEEAPAVGFEEWAKDWLRRAERRIKGKETAQLHVNRHLIPAFGRKPLNAITVQDVNAWVGERLAHVKPATAKRELDTLKTIFNDAKRSGLVAENPCNNAERIRGIVPRQRFLSGDELVLLLAEAEKAADWLPDFITWCLHSGMRKSEVLSLEWRDVRPLDENRVLIEVKSSKADKPRFVSCTSTMLEVLERQNGRKREGSDHVFPITRMTLRRRWEKARKGAGLEDVTLHDLRRTHSTHAAAAGVDLKTLAGRIGHADLTMLQKHYAVVVESADRQAAETIEEVFRGMMAKA